MDGTEYKPLNGNAYLALAYTAIWNARRPLTPTEILEIAQSQGFLPPQLFGATMHKTLTARLAEHIREKSGKSLFYRTAPNTFFVHSLASDASIPDEFRKVFIGNLRAKRIRKENVLVAPRNSLEGEFSGNFIPFHQQDFSELFLNECFFLDRSFAEEDQSVKQFVTFTLVVNDYKILIHTRGKFSTASDTLKGQTSVGFGGHVNEHDFTLFSLGADAFRANAARELREELFLDEYYDSFDETRARTSISGYINVDDSNDARHHIAVIVLFYHKSSELPKKGELSINALRWLDLRHRLNDLSQFDLWSGIILRNIYEGTLKI